MTGKKAIVRVSREKWSLPLLCRYQIFLDGEKVGSLRQGASCSFETEPGRHSLDVEVSTGGGTESPLWFSLHPGEEAKFICRGPSTEEVAMRRGWAALTVYRVGGESPSSVPTPESLEQLLTQALDDENSGRYTQAESLYRRALALQEQELGPEQSETASTLNDLGRLYERQQKWEQARPFLERAQEIWGKAENPPYPEAMINLGDLAAIYESLDRYEQAEQLNQRALELAEQNRGSEHIDTAQALIFLALTYAHHGKYEQARPLYERVQAIARKVSGADEPAFQDNLGLLDQIMEDAS